jgi:hypothetical protein
LLNTGDWDGERRPKLFSPRRRSWHFRKGGRDMAVAKKKAVKKVAAKPKKAAPKKK